MIRSISCADRAPYPQRDNFGIAGELSQHFSLCLSGHKGMFELQLLTKNTSGGHESEQSAPTRRLPIKHDSTGPMVPIVIGRTWISRTSPEPGRGAPACRNGSGISLKAVTETPPAQNLPFIGSVPRNRVQDYVHPCLHTIM